ncbi:MULTISPECIES: alpha/beta hydrolase family protein [unclassified Streptomyces]|uniref:S9 family peptidase n=1 Tax=unclassified Streptomyces TaxID=2593676 RepID=UPI000748C02B|nr:MULTISPECIES: S9 family peptidase [unclassified Streptomyces]KUL58726.1 peptidase [Streptomyces sp. NRRL S-1521]THC51768.1 S9 family peptidase [Streptomyces sp. A1499]
MTPIPPPTSPHAPPRIPPLIPVEDFCRTPVATSGSISPDGTRIAYLAPERGRLNVWTRGVDTAADGGTEFGDAVCVTHDHHRDIHSYHWTDDPRWLLYTQDGDGDENWHVFRVDLEDPDAPAVDLTPFPGVRTTDFWQPGGLPGTVIAVLNRRRRDQFDVHRITIATGEHTIVAENPGHIGGWLCGRHGELFATVVPPAGGHEIHSWDPETGTSRPITAYDGADLPMGLTPSTVTPDGTGIWLGSNRGSDLIRLTRLDVATGEETVVDSHPTYELDTRSGVNEAFPSPLILSGRTGEILAVRYLGERQAIHALDPHFAAVYERLSRLSHGDLDSVSSDTGGRRWVVSFTHDTEPGVTHYYDHETGESRELFRPHPHLDPAALAVKHPVSFTARDGLTVHGYLTLPVGVAPTRLPLVLLVHGGPWFRDGPGYEPRVQLLANRGYAVLQVNMRGSSGYGAAFTRAAVREFAGRMHDDLVDAVDWAVGAGYADPRRVGIFGGSYGGYSALVGVTFTPDVFAAAVDLCGISDLANFIRTLPAFARPLIGNNFLTYVGDPDVPEDEADMLARSPITRVDRIRTPLMVIQGANDVRVVREESDLVVGAVRARGVEVEYLVKADEGHRFQNPENLIDVYRAVERFLARHLGGRQHPSDLISHRAAAPHIPSQ